MGVDGASRRRAEERKGEEQSGREKKKREKGRGKCKKEFSDISEPVASLTFNHLLC